MVKPRRKHVKEHIWQESAPGRTFSARLREAIGEGWSYVPAGYHPAGRAHHFTVGGALDAAELVEHQEEAVDAAWRSRVQLLQRRWTLDGSGLFVLTLVAHRPDAALYEEAGISGPPPRLSKADSRRWWEAERARVGDERDELFEAFIPDETPVPFDLERNLPARAIFPCAECSGAAAVVTWWPAGERCPDIPGDDDVPASARLVIAFGDRVLLFAEAPGFSWFDGARDAVRAHDPGALASLFPEWGIAWCAACDDCYCQEHWTGSEAARACPSGHPWNHPTLAT